MLARAGLARLGRLDEVTEVLDPLQMLPAPGQGALAVECRAGDAELVSRVREALDDPRTRAAVTAERAVLATLEAGCSAPVGAMAEIAEGDDGDELWLRAVALSPDGAVAVRRSATGSPGDAEKVGRALAEEMLADGASALIEERRHDEQDHAHEREQAQPPQRQEGDCEQRVNRPPAPPRRRPPRAARRPRVDRDGPSRARSGSWRSWAADRATRSC